MTYSRTQIGAFLVVAAVIAVVAMAGFGVPFGTLLIIGLFLCCPLMMLGMHGGGRRGGSPADTASGVEPTGRPSNER